MGRILRFLCVPLLLTCGVPAQATVDQARADELLALAKARFAPDRRTVVFDVAATADAARVTLAGEVHDAALARQLCEWFRTSAGCEVVDALRALPDPALGDATRGVVCVSVANVRTKPGHAEELATQALLGTPLQILKRQDGWSYVQLPNGYLGWTNDRVQPLTNDGFAAWHARSKVVVTATFAVVRASAVADAPPVGDVVAGCLLARDDGGGDGGDDGGCYRVRYADGRTGCLPKTAAAPFDDWLARAADTPANLVATARRFVGVPYLWGGTSTKGMDCSGFTSTVFFLNGVLLPRDASQQVLVGVPVEHDAQFRGVEAGDLLFFGSAATATKKERVTHVAISLGGARFIHSSTDVHENSLAPDDPDYAPSLRQRLLHVRRIVGAGPDAGVRHLTELDCYRKP